jgi:phosphoribosyl 1,2-cyclic phosphodiesterase
MEQGWIGEPREIARARDGAVVASLGGMTIHIRFWGVRGSVAAAGERTAGVGGNTSCVEVAHDGHTVIFDAGTGLRALGADLLRRARPVEAHVFVSHFHWDHIQGFPFFAPAYVPGSRLAIYGVEDVRAAFERQMKPPHFPVGLDAMRATLAFATIGPGHEVNLGHARVRAGAARHPNGCLAFRFVADGRSVVYATDTEHDPTTGELDPRLLELARGTDVLIYDAQYTEEEYASRHGWGHSTAAEGARLARAAGVGQLVLFHHDPSHDDEAIERIEREARALFPCTTAAREGLVMELSPAAEHAAA